MMLVIGAHSLMSHWSDVLSGITLQGLMVGPVFYVIQGHHYFRQLTKPAQHRCQRCCAGFVSCRK